MLLKEKIAINYEIFTKNTKVVSVKQVVHVVNTAVKGQIRQKLFFFNYVPHSLFRHTLLQRVRSLEFVSDGVLISKTVTHLSLKVI